MIRRPNPDEIPAFVRDVLLSPTRQRPVIGLTTHVHPTRLMVDVERLAADVDGRADVVVLETGDVTWALSAEMPPRLDVYGGASRIWWPGLTRASDPHDHPLMLIYDPADTPRVEARLRAAILGKGEGGGSRGVGAPAAGGRREPSLEARPGQDIVEAVFVEAGEHAVKVTVGGSPCLVDRADCPPGDVGEDIHPGHELRVRRTDRTLDGLPVVEVRGVRQDPWRRLMEVYQVGDIVHGRIARLTDGYVLVEVLPGASLIAMLSELDWTFVHSPADLFRVGDPVTAKILTLEPGRHRGSLSIKQAIHLQALRHVSPALGQPPFLLDGEPASRDAGPLESHAAPAAPPDEDAGDADELAGQLEAALQDRADLLAANKALKEQVAGLRRELRALDDRLRDVQNRVSGGLDPTASEVAFLVAVRVAYARRFDEGDRLRYPLQRMRVGREFLQRLRDLEGISVEKVVEVCAQVASLRAQEIKAREVHPLRDGPGGAPTRVRARDGARAWRCSLQDGTASARRLHWWDVPGKERVIEFASVGVHDELGIPE